jgi:hypothetical protein
MANDMRILYDREGERLAHVGCLLVGNDDVGHPELERGAERCEIGEAHGVTEKIDRIYSSSAAMVGNGCPFADSPNDFVEAGGYWTVLGILSIHFALHLECGERFSSLLPFRRRHQHPILACVFFR